MFSSDLEVAGLQREASSRLDMMRKRREGARKLLQCENQQKQSEETLQQRREHLQRWPAPVPVSSRT